MQTLATDFLILQHSGDEQFFDCSTSHSEDRLVEVANNSASSNLQLALITQNRNENTERLEVEDLQEMITMSDFRNELYTENTGISYFSVSGRILHPALLVSTKSTKKTWKTSLI